MSPEFQLDLQVHQALGHDLERQFDDDAKDIPRYSTDWNSAMASAEKFGLFGERGLMLGKSNHVYEYPGGAREQWYLEEPASGMDGDGPNELVHALTGPEAICRAILKLKGK
jgi:hypothetical protein